MVNGLSLMNHLIRKYRLIPGSGNTHTMCGSWREPSSDIPKTATTSGETDTLLGIPTLNKQEESNSKRICGNLILKYLFIEEAGCLTNYPLFLAINYFDFKILMIFLYILVHLKKLI